MYCMILSCKKRKKKKKVTCILKRIVKPDVSQTCVFYYIIILYSNERGKNFDEKCFQRYYKTLIFFNYTHTTHIHNLNVIIL